MSIDDWREAAILSRVVELVRGKKTFCGETLLQKSAFFLKELCGVPISADFRIYYYGPFSFDLRDRLGSMEALDVVRTEPHDWGASYKPGDRYPMLAAQQSAALGEYDREIHWVVNELAPLSVKQLEPLATALFLARTEMTLDADARAQRLTEIKPHIKLADARAAVSKVDAWIEQRAAS